jgi:hypothetical protein
MGYPERPAQRASAGSASRTAAADVPNRADLAAEGDAADAVPAVDTADAGRAPLAPRAGQRECAHRDRHAEERARAARSGGAPGRARAAPDRDARGRPGAARDAGARGDLRARGLLGPRRGRRLDDRRCDRRRADGDDRRAAWTLSGKFGAALSFDGVNDSVSVADAEPLHLTNGTTLEAWVRPAGAERMADGDPQGAPHRPRVRALRQQHREPAGDACRYHVRPRPRRHRGARAEHLDASGGAVRRRDAAPVRQRHAGRDARGRAADPGVGRPAALRRNAVWASTSTASSTRSASTTGRSARRSRRATCAVNGVTAAARHVAACGVVDGAGGRRDGERVVDRGDPQRQATTSASAAWTWRILSPVAVDYSSDGLDGNGEPRGDGWPRGLASA